MAARGACMVAAVAVNPETAARQLSAGRLALQNRLWEEGRWNKLDHLELDLAQCKESFALDLHRQSTHPHHFEQIRERLISSSKASLLRLEARLQPLSAESPWETAVRELLEHEAEQRLDVMGWEQFGSTDLFCDFLRKCQRLLAALSSRPRAEAVTDDDLEPFVLSAARSAPSSASPSSTSGKALQGSLRALLSPSLAPAATSTAQRSSAATPPSSPTTCSSTPSAVTPSSSAPSAALPFSASTPPATPPASVAALSSAPSSRLLATSPPSSSPDLPAVLSPASAPSPAPALAPAGMQPALEPSKKTHRGTRKGWWPLKV